jgi:hypothetical protein|tara:strand:- start:6973 stop:7275 length:303 start_codon:yes stop_codon:yes gene_type:complete
MIKQVKQVVTETLEGDIRTRDNDSLLLATVWFRQIGEQIQHMSASDFLKTLAHGDLYKPYSITRCRRKVQELNSNLRGASYSKRKKDMTEKIKEEIRTMK